MEKVGKSKSHIDSSRRDDGREKAVKSTKLGKAAGVSQIAAEYEIASGMVGIEVITGMANSMFDGECIADDWGNSVLVPLYKGKGNVSDCGIDRGVMLLEHGMMEVERCLTGC